MGKLRFKLQLLIMVCIICSAATIITGFACKEVERNALLKFAHGFESFDDPTYLLGLWVEGDCCNWKGVTCDILTGNVAMLDLGSLDLYAREVNDALIELKFLRYLGLSNISFMLGFPKFLGSISQLQHLDLSHSHFFAEVHVPQNLGNLTELVSLDLSYCYACLFNHLEWASRLENLQYLDLTGIDFSQATDSLNMLIHKLLPSLMSLTLADCQLGNSHHSITNLSISSSPLQHLNLSSNFFSGRFPSFIQNLSYIKYLDLSHNQLSSSPQIWLGNQLDLIELDLGDNNFTGSYLSFIQNLSSVESLDLSGNCFSPPLPSWIASKNLINLGLDRNCFNGPFPQFLQNSSYLKSIDLSDNQFSLSVPSWMTGKRELEYVDLSNNQFDHVDGGVMNALGRLYSLQVLDLSYNKLQEEIKESQTNLSRWAKYDSQSLSMSSNRISHHHLPMNKSFSSLQFLDLSHNNLESVSPFLGSFSSLYYLNLSHNHLSVVHQASLANLSSLRYLDISSNYCILDLPTDWTPPFQLESLAILSCKLSGLFPKWLLRQSQITELDLSEVGILGPLPHNIGNAMPSLQGLRLANNHINGSIPASLCESINLNVLDLQKNWLSGMIPDCWENSQALLVVELSSNNLSGPVPNSLAQVPNLQMLSLSNNSLDGELPDFTSTPRQFVVLDVGRNNLHGEIPPWNADNFPSLQILILRENRLKGVISPQLCSIITLEIIDLAKNGLTGTIPRCFGHFRGMGPTPNLYNDQTQVPILSNYEWSAVEVIKGKEIEYTTVLHLLVNMDLSYNNLVGVIPPSIKHLSGLIGLNLSHNHLSGSIPKDIGEMTALESLDLSRNNLSGSIPESVTFFTFLCKMNLSFNNLHGKIPVSRQLQTLDDAASMYWGNPGLCGDPLPKKCFSNGILQTSTSTDSSKDEEEEEEEDEHEKIWFYMVIILGFASGFWGVIGILVVKRRWRHAYFGVAEEIGDWLYVRVALWIAKVNVSRASTE